MSFNKTVKTEDGNEKNIVASSQEELDAAVKVAEGESAPTYPNINKPVQKGHDKVDVQDDLSVDLKDGTGAHNSPRNAVKDDGSAEGAYAGEDEPDTKQVSGPDGNQPVEGKAQESDVPPKDPKKDGSTKKNVKKSK